MPCSSAVSLRDPDLIHTPRAALRDGACFRYHGQAGREPGALLSSCALSAFLVSNPRMFPDEVLHSIKLRSEGVEPLLGMRSASHVGSARSIPYRFYCGEFRRMGGGKRRRIGAPGFSCLAATKALMANADRAGSRSCCGVSRIVWACFSVWPARNFFADGFQRILFDVESRCFELVAACRRHHDRRPRTAGARSSTRSGYPWTARWWP